MWQYKLHNTIHDEVIYAWVLDRKWIEDTFSWLAEQRSCVNGYHIASLLTKIVNLTVIVPIYWNVFFSPLRWEVANKILYFNRQQPHLLLPGRLYLIFSSYSLILGKTRSVRLEVYIYSLWCDWSLEWIIQWLTHKARTAVAGCINHLDYSLYKLVISFFSIRLVITYFKSVT